MTTIFDRNLQLAQNGDPEAQVRIAKAWSTGEVVPYPDEGQALQWYKAASKQGNAIEKYKYACALYWGIGTEPNDNGIYVVAYQLTKIFELGLGGIEKDQGEAGKWQAIAKHSAQMYEQSREEKRRFYSQFDFYNPYGQYLRGVASVHTNQKEAMAWFKAAASQGNVGAQNYWNSVYSLASASYKPNIPSFEELKRDRDYFSCLLKRDNWEMEFYHNSIFVIEEADLDKLMQ